MSNRANATAYAQYPRQQRAKDHYREIEIKTADPFGLILILYRGAIHCLQEAVAALSEGDIEGRFRSIDRAMALVGELKASLDLQKGQHIAISLDLIYNYMLDRLTQSNLRKDPALLEEVIRLLKCLEGAWEGARLNLRREQAKPLNIELSA